MSDTPQTDAAVEDTILHDRNHPRIDWVDASFARKLERACNSTLRQRDQALADQENSRQSLAFALEELEEARNEIHSVCTERDEARTELAKRGLSWMGVRG